MEGTMETVTSKDGTRIAYEKLGSGPALILVDGALCSRKFGPMPKLAPLLAKHFTVYMYDRRGRGESGDTQPYSKQREIEDLRALVQAAGGKAHVLGLSSGGALALEAAASGVPFEKVVAYEPPYVQGAANEAEPGHEQKLKALIAEGKRGDAVRYFMQDMIGAPKPVVVLMGLMPWIFGKLKAVAHTLPYDAAVMGNFSVPSNRLREVKVPTLVMHGSKTDNRLKTAAESVARSVPSAKHHVLDKQTHNVAPAALMPPVVEFLRA
jgi:pimeloyl-ACP methyl ester carboxylesterase